MKNTMWATVTDMHNKLPFRVMDVANITINKGIIGILWADEQGKAHWEHLDAVRFAVEVFSNEDEGQ